MERFINSIRQTASRVVQTARVMIEFVRDKLSDYMGLYSEEKTDYEYSEREKDVMRAMVGYMRDYFDCENDPGEALAREAFEDRCMAIEDFTRRIGEAAGIEELNIAVTNSDEAFPPHEGISFCCANYREKCIYFNAAVLSSDDPKVLTEMITGAVHEMRHMMQFRAMMLEDTYGTSYETRYRWRRNIVNYVKGEEDFEGYYTQPVETDARLYETVIYHAALQKG